MTYEISVIDFLQEKKCLVGFGAVALLLAGCATPDPVTIRVPVPIKCIDRVPERPYLRTDAELLAMDDFELVLSLARDRRLFQGYTAELEAVVEGCR